MRDLWVSLVILTALLPLPIAAQTTTATVQGTITDRSGAFVPGATVTLRATSTGFVRSTSSDMRGGYTLPFVPVGAYTLTVALQGFKTVTRAGLRFAIGQETTVDVVLEEAAIAEEVTVSADTPIVQTTKSTVDTVVRRETIDNLPLNGRQATSLAMLAPGVVSTGRVTDPVGQAGQPRGSGEMLVDGVSNEIAVNNGVRSGAPPDAIEEFQVLTSQYQAEFGSALGLVLNTVTRSGTNQLHGRGFYFHRDEGLDARNPFATTKASFEQKQGGGWIGGPIVRNRSHFFVTHESTRRTTIAHVVGSVDPGDYEVPSENNQWLAKLTHQWTSAHHLTARVLVDRPLQNIGVGGLNPPEMGVDFKLYDTSYVANLASVLSDRVLHEVRVQYADTLTDQQPRQPDAITIARPSSLRGKFPDVPQHLPERRVQVVDNITFEAGSHRLKAGVDISHVVEDGFFMGNRPGIFAFETDEPFDPARPATYPVLFQTTEGDPNFRFVANGVSAFAQDSWRLPQRVTLNAGVRFDTWDVSGMDLDRVNLAPRLGVAWDPIGSGRTVIRAGYGLFYNNVMTNTSLYADFYSRQRAIAIVNPGYPDPYASGTVLNLIENSYVELPGQRVPRSYNTTVGFQRELRPGLSVSADYVNARARKLLRLIETNPVLPETLRRQDPTRGFVRAVEASGYSNSHALLVSGSNRFGRIATAGIAYTLGTAKATNDNEFTYTLQSDIDRNDSYGYSNLDRRHRAVLHGTVRLPWDFQVAALLQVQSGVPYNITLGRDANRNTTSNDRPDLAPGARLGTDDMRKRSSFVDPGTRPGNLPRNAGRTDGSWTLDARLAKRITLKGARLELLVEAFNLDNHVTLGGPVSTLTSPLFGQSISAGDARQVQLGVRIDF